MFTILGLTTSPVRLGHLITFKDNCQPGCWADWFVPVPSLPARKVGQSMKFDSKIVRAFF